MAPVVRELLRRRPDLRVVAWGGPRLEEAGAEIVERTADDGVMGLGGFLKAHEIKKVIDRIDAWAASHPIACVPVDSPSANFPICERLRARGPAPSTSSHRRCGPGAPGGSSGFVATPT